MNNPKKIDKSSHALTNMLVVFNSRIFDNFLGVVQVSRGWLICIAARRGRAGRVSRGLLTGSRSSRCCGSRSGRFGLALFFLPLCYLRIRSSLAILKKGQKCQLIFFYKRPGSIVLDILRHVIRGQKKERNSFFFILSGRKKARKAIYKLITWKQE